MPPAETASRQRPVLRFAPSPNGRLHLGHAYAALYAYQVAQAINARFLLRIDDIDTARCTHENEASILDDLAWLGLRWEQPVWRQSEHFQTYREAAARLHARGVLYPCFASRKEIAEAVARAGIMGRDPDGAPIYPGLYRDADPDEVARLTAEGRPHALRLDMRRALDAIGRNSLRYRVFDPNGRASERPAQPQRWGDAVIVRKDTPASYHLATVVDDAAQGVTHVVRGQDLEAATDLHVLLQRLLGLPTPAYHHHRLILDDSGRKLSKSAGDMSLASLRAEGATPDDIRSMVGLVS